MSLPTLVKTHQMNVNNTQTAQGSATLDNQALLFAIKGALKGFAVNPLTVNYSCNSVTAGTAADGVDRWVTASNLVFAAAGSAHSWIVLNIAGIASGAQLMISCNSGANNVNAIIRVSTSAGFTGGTTTADPTATDQITILSGAWSALVSDLQIRWSVWLATDGSLIRMIAYAAGNPIGTWIIDVPANAKSGFTIPFYGYANGTANANTGTTLSNLTTLAMVSRIGSTNCNMTFTCEGAATGGALFSNATIGQIANEVDLAWDFYPLGLASSTVGTRGRDASAVDIWFGSSAITSGDSYPATGTTGQFAQFGNLILPWNTGPVNLT